MHGFFGTYGVKVEWRLSSFSDNMLRRTFSDDVMTLEQVTLPKFAEDKVWLSNDSVFIAVEGVLLNLTELKQEYKDDDAAGLLYRLYCRYGIDMVNSLRGSFAVVIYDKKTKQCFVANDQTGSHLLYICEYNGGVLFCSDLKVLQQVVRHTLSRSFACTMLTFGYSPVCETPVDGVRRIGAGERVRINGSGVHPEVYHRFTAATESSVSLSDYIDEFDVLFRRAVSRVVQKNRDYGLMNYMPLSAGLDSRMAVVVASRVEQGDIHNFTYSQTGYYDEVVPREIAASLGNTWLFKPLDGGDYLKCIDEVAGKTDGLVQLSGAAQAEDIVPLLPRERIGVIATGMLGDIIANSYTKCPERSLAAGEGAESKRLLSILPDSVDEQLRQWTNRELYYLYVRGFYCANLGAPVIFQHFTESVSPFCDVDVLQLCMNIPPRLRWNYRFYDSWIKRYYPEAVAWKHNGVQQIGNRQTLAEIGNRKMMLRDVPRRLLMKLLKDMHIANLYKATEGSSMNPEDTWLRENKSLRKVFDDYYKVNTSCHLPWDDVEENISRLYASGTAMEKMQVLSLLAAIKRYV